MPANLDPAALAALRRLHEAADPAPWSGDWDIRANWRGMYPIILTAPIGRLHRADDETARLALDDARLVIVLRNALPALLALAERAAALDPALLARLETRYAHPGIPACEKCGAMLIAAPPGYGSTIALRTLLCCPIALAGGAWEAESAVKVHFVESLRYVTHGDDDVLALVAAVRGLAGGEGDE